MNATTTAASDSQSILTHDRKGTQGPYDNRIAIDQESNRISGFKIEPELKSNLSKKSTLESKVEHDASCKRSTEES